MINLELYYRNRHQKFASLIKFLKSPSSRILKDTIVTKHLDTGKSLVIAPHPDDEIIGAGGIICRHHELGNPVTIVYMTDGRYLEASKYRSFHSVGLARRREAERIGKKLGVQQIFLDIEDTTLENCKEAEHILSNLIINLQPTQIYAPSFFELHPDHAVINRLLYRVLQPMAFDPLTIIGYEVGVHNPFPNYIVDITSFFEEKKDLLNLYSLPLTVQNITSLCEHRVALNYLLYVDPLKSGYAEAFSRMPAQIFLEMFHDYEITLQS